MGFHNPFPLEDPTSSLAYHPVTGSDTIYNSSSLPLTDIVHFNPLRIRQPHGFKMHLLERGFHTLIRNVSFLSQIDVGFHNPFPLGDPTSSLAYHPVTGSDTICNSSLPLADIVRFNPLCIAVSLTVLKRVY